jgi:Saxitoxin biosynthesis operon protein SxtJ
MATVLEPKLEQAAQAEGSDRGFGFVFAGVFTLYGFWPLLHSESPRWWAIAVAAAFALSAIVLPGILHPLNRVWLAFGRLLHHVVSPLVMGAVFFLCVTPIGWIMRRVGMDVLSLKPRADLRSYWIMRDPSPPPTEAMKNQF